MKEFKEKKVFTNVLLAVVIIGVLVGALGCSVKESNETDYETETNYTNASSDNDIDVNEDDDNVNLRIDETKYKGGSETELDNLVSSENIANGSGDNSSEIDNPKEGPNVIEKNTESGKLNQDSSNTSSKNESKTEGKTEGNSQNSSTTSDKNNSGGKVTEKEEEKTTKPTTKNSGVTTTKTTKKNTTKNTTKNTSKATTKPTTKPTTKATTKPTTTTTTKPTTKATTTTTATTPTATTIKGSGVWVGGKELVTDPGNWIPHSLYPFNDAGFKQASAVGDELLSDFYSDVGQYAVRPAKFTDGSWNYVLFVIYF